MMRRSVAPGIEIADQPTAEELGDLAREGFTAVVNLRREGEPEELYTPAEEAELARAAGLEYLHMGVGGGPIDPAGMEAVHAFLDGHADGKVLIHCKQGGRAAAVALLHHARTENWPAESVVRRGLQEGFPLPPGLQLLVGEYLRNLPG